MKVTFLITGFTEGGAQKQCIYLINQLQKTPGIQLQLIYFLDGINFDYLIRDNLIVSRIETQSLYKISNVGKINEKLAEFNPDILFTWLHACDIFGFFLKLIRPRMKWIIAERDSKYPSSLKYIARRFLGKFSNLIICNSNSGREYWTKGLWRKSNTLVASNIYIKPDVSANFSLSGSPIILYAGRFEDQKNILTVAKAFCKFSLRHENAMCYLVGKGTKEIELIQIISQYKCDRQVRILPFQKDIGSFFNNCDIFVNVSFHEGAPNTVIEASAARKKILVSYIKEHVDLLGADYSYYLMNLCDVDELLIKMEDLLNADYQENNFFAEKFDQMQSVKVASTYINFFNKCIS